MDGQICQVKRNLLLAYRTTLCLQCGYTKGLFMPSHRWRRIPNLSGYMPPERPSPQHITLRGLSLAEVEAFAVRACWERLKGNHVRMARELGVARSTLHRKLNALGLRKRRVFLRGK